MLDGFPIIQPIASKQWRDIWNKYTGNSL